MNGYEDEERGSCLMPFLIGLVFGFMGFWMIKWIITILVWIGSHF